MLRLKSDHTCNQLITFPEKKYRMYSKKFITFLIILSFALVPYLSVDSAEAQILETRYDATSIAGNQAPPNYGMRLDGFFTGNEADAITFAFDSVFFDVFTNGTARLYGDVSVVEVNGSAPTGSEISSWDLDVAFNAGSGSNPSYQYFVIDPNAGTEMVNQANANDIVDLWSYNGDFQVGFSANGKNSNFGASGWVTFEHYDGTTTYGSQGTQLVNSDFLMDLTVVPEPVSSTLFLVGGATLGFRRFRKKFKK